MASGIPDKVAEVAQNKLILKTVWKNPKIIITKRSGQYGRGIT